MDKAPAFAFLAIIGAVIAGHTISSIISTAKRQMRDDPNGWHAETWAHVPFIALSISIVLFGVVGALGGLG